jgi:uncharacterized protein DUF6458
MTIGVALFLLAVGAILRFAVTSVSTHGINVHTVGDILMIVGVVGLVIWLFVWAPWARSRRAAYRRRPPADAETHVHDVYRTDARDYEDLPPR